MYLVELLGTCMYRAEGRGLVGDVCTVARMGNSPAKGYPSAVVVGDLAACINYIRYQGGLKASCQLPLLDTAPSPQLHIGNFAVQLRNSELCSQEMKTVLSGQH